MYNEKLAVAIKSNGKVLRENKDQVYLPFGQEYAIYIKNLNTVRAVVNIFIDGDDVTGGGLVINANDSVNLERYIRNGNLKEGNKFKFIERSSSIEQHRGVKAEDGLIRVEYQFEKPQPQFDWDKFKKQIDDLQKEADKIKPDVKPWTPYSPWDPYKPFHPYKPYWHDNSGGISWDTGDNTYYCTADVSRCATFTNSTATTTTSTPSANFVASGSVQGYTYPIFIPTTQAVTSPNENGITVPGALSNQEFVIVTVGELEATKHVIVLKLLGEVAGKTVEVPVTVKVKPKCVTCGRQNKATAKFCTNCGTSLRIV